MTAQEIEKSGNLIYKYIRGSHCHGIATETSDTDYGGIFIIPNDKLLGLRSEYIEQISDEKSDIVYYEIGRTMELLIKSNPTALESLFVDPQFIIGDIHPYIKYLRDNRDAFLSKDVFNNIIGYAISQIKKCRGLNKKIVNPVVERKGVLDFCYIADGQGTKNIANWLNDRGLFQKYCGLVALHNMHDSYGLYYDWGTHIICEYDVDFTTGKNIKSAWNKICKEMDDWSNNTQCFGDTLLEYVITNPYRTYLDQFKDIIPYGFTGIVNQNENSNDVRVSSIPKNIKPLGIISYNKCEYESHCKNYKEYKEWEAHRNPVRYESNLLQNYDSKNMAECIRLLHMGIEIAQGKGFNVLRTWDRKFLLDIRAHKYEYDEIIKYVEDKKDEMNNAILSSTLPEHIDYNFVNNLLINIRKEQLSIC